jgi:hypothetical protein
MQSLSDEQVVRHAPPLHLNWPQPTWDWTQLALVPLQCPTGVKVVALLHEAVPHDVDDEANWQAPPPSQVPVEPHGGAGVQPLCGSMAPAGTNAQVPALPVTLHDEQVPQLPVPQQTPSTQKLLAHSPAIPQSWPRRFLPHELLMQKFPGAQSPSAVQVALQLVPLQAKGAQLCMVCAVAGLHVPLPSQVRASVAVVVPTGQIGSAHCVPAG